MRFLALLKKELRECLPWMIVAAVLFLAIGGLTLRGQIRWRLDYPHHFYRFDTDGEIIKIYNFLKHSVLSTTGVWLLLISVGFGLALGVRQYWIGDFTGIWGFELHRSVSRMSILLSKLAAVMVGLVVSVGILWTLFYLYACQSEELVAPVRLRVFFEGWLFICVGYLSYLATGLCGLSRARWFTTKLFGLGFAIVACFMMMLSWRLSVALSVIVIGGAILLSQIIDTFLNREF